MEYIVLYHHKNGKKTDGLDVDALHVNIHSNNQCKNKIDSYINVQVFFDIEQYFFHRELLKRIKNTLQR